MAQVSTLSSSQPQISALDALWTLFQTQSKAVRSAFTQRLLKEAMLSKPKENTVATATEIKQLDSLLYGSIHLPADFDDEKEMQETLASKYSF